MSKLFGKIALVTGASKGIGAAIARSLAAEGASVAVNYASSKEGADRLVDEIIKGNGRAIAVHGDVAKQGDIERMFAQTHRALGQLDILSDERCCRRIIGLACVIRQRPLLVGERSGCGAGREPDHVIATNRTRCPYRNLLN